MRFYWPIAKADTERRMVWGYASTEALDHQGEIVTREALAAALDEYMRFANIREMHQNSAVGIAKEAGIDDRGLFLAAKIVDDAAWQKVVEGVYNGFSIGGRITARDPADRKVITGLVLTEISVVDRPANPEAVFDCWKLGAGAAAAADMAEPQPDREPGTEPDEADLPDGATGSPAPAASVALRRLARILIDLEWLRDRIAAEAPAPEKTTAPRRLSAIIDEVCEFVCAALVNHGARRPGEAGADHPIDLAALAPAGALRKQREPEAAALADSLARLADAILPRLDALQKRVEDIASTPLPAQTAARGFGIAGLSKQEDGGGAAAPAEDIVAALSRMTDEERTLVLIKAAHARPIAPFARTG